MMTRLLLCLALLLPAAARAACTFTEGAAKSSVATCTTGTEAAAPSGAEDGLGLEGWFFGKPTTGIAVFAETAGTMTAGGTLQAWLLNPATSVWQRAPDLDLTTQALANQGWIGLKIVASRGRVAFKPSGTGLATTIYLVPSYQ